MKKPALTPYDIGEIMAARMHGATCKTLGERYGRTAEAIRQLVLRNLVDDGTNVDCRRRGVSKVHRPRRPSRFTQGTHDTGGSEAATASLSREQIDAVGALFDNGVPIAAIISEYARRSVPEPDIFLGEKRYIRSNSVSSVETAKMISLRENGATLEQIADQCARSITGVCAVLKREVGKTGSKAFTNGKAPRGGVDGQARMSIRNEGIARMKLAGVRTVDIAAHYGLSRVAVQVVIRNMRVSRPGQRKKSGANPCL